MTGHQGFVYAEEAPPRIHVIINKEEEDDMCCECEDGDNLLPCSGGCGRVCHYYVPDANAAGDPAPPCNALGLPSEVYRVWQENEEAEFLCPYCLLAEHPCLKCGELGRVLPTGAKAEPGTVQQCNSCPRYYHPECLGGQFASSGACPRHRCRTCNKAGKSSGDQVLIGCRRCPTAFHDTEKCIPWAIATDPNRIWLTPQVACVCDDHKPNSEGRFDHYGPSPDHFFPNEVLLRYYPLLAEDRYLKDTDWAVQVRAGTFQPVGGRFQQPAARDGARKGHRQQLGSQGAEGAKAVAGGEAPRPGKRRLVVGEGSEGLGEEGREPPKRKERERGKVKEEEGAGPRAASGAAADVGPQVQVDEVALAKHSRDTLALAMQTDPDLFSIEKMVKGDQGLKLNLISAGVPGLHKSFIYYRDLLEEMESATSNPDTALARMKVMVKLLRYLESKFFTPTTAKVVGGPSK